MTDFSTDSRPAPNGPAPFPARPDEPQNAPGGPPRVPARSPELAGAGVPRPVGGPPTATAPQPAPREVAPEVKGRIRIADEVVEKVAALAAMEVPGVADLGGDIARALESVRERVGIGNKRGDQGVKAEVKGQEVAINVTIMVEFGHVVMEVARQVQANVAAQTNRMLGLRVVEVNVTVDDVRTAPPSDREGAA
jgi:uncharacterized alkaline shock family protein YloU